MKVKIINRTSYQTYPVTEDMVEIEESVLKEIGKTKQFGNNGEIIDYFNEEEKKEMRISEINSRLTALTQDFVQVECGEIIEDIDSRKTEFVSLHNELRILLGKEPRELK